MKNAVLMGSYVPSSGGLDKEIGGIPLPVILLVGALFVVIILFVCIRIAINSGKPKGGRSVQPQMAPTQPVQPAQPQMAPMQPVQPAQPQMAPMQSVQPAQPQMAPTQPVQPQMTPVQTVIQPNPVQPLSYTKQSGFSEAEDDGTQIMLEDDSTQILSQKEYVLCLTDTKDPNRVFQMPLNGTVVVGRRAGEANLVIDYEKSVSGRHCQIREADGRIYVEDLQSANGTVVNGMRIQSETEIAPGSILTLGRLELKVDIRLQ